MKTYDATFIFSTGLDQPEIDNGIGAVRSEIEKLGGSAEQVVSLGRRSFARTMNKQNEGIFVMMRFNLDPTKMDALNGRLKLNTSIFRTQILVAGSSPLNASGQKKEKAEAEAVSATAEEGSNG